MVDKLANIQKLHAKPPHWGWVGGLYLAGNDDGIAMRLLDGQEYEPQSRKLWRSLSKDADMVVDVGAHTGIYSLDAWNSGAKQVFSIEPYPLNYARLKMNLRHAGFSSASCALCAVGEGKGRSFINASALDYYCSSGCRIGVYDGDRLSNQIFSYPVMVFHLDDLLKGEYHSQVRAVKIDAEKHGLSVLRSMPDILSYKPDLILECIETGMGEILTPLGYRFYTIHEQTGLHPVENLIPDEPFTFDSPNRYATVDGDIGAGIG